MLSLHINDERQKMVLKLHKPAVLQVTVVTVFIRRNRFLQRKRFRLRLLISPYRGLSVRRLSRSCTWLEPFDDLDAVWKEHLWGPMTRCVRWGSVTPPPRKGEIWGSNPKHVQLQKLLLPPGE